MAAGLRQEPLAGFGRDAFLAPYVAGRTWNKHNPQIAQGFLKAMKDSTEWIKRQQANMPEIVAAHSRLTAKPAPTFTSSISMPEFHHHHLQNAIKSTAKYGFIKRRLEVSELIPGYAGAVSRGAPLGGFCSGRLHGQIH